MSSKRRSGVGMRLMFAGRSVKGTRVSPCARAGSAHSGTPSAARPAIARLPLRMSRRSRHAFKIIMLHIMLPFGVLGAGETGCPDATHDPHSTVTFGRRGPGFGPLDVVGPPQV